MTTYVRTHGRHLRWTIAELRRNGVNVQRIEKALGRDFFIVADADEKTVDNALRAMKGYRPRKRKPAALRILDALMLVGLGVAGAVALVTPIGGVVVLAWLGVARLVGGKLHENAAIMHQAGGRYRLYAVIGMALMLLLAAGFIAAAGGLAGAQIAAGNSALKLLQVQP